MFFVVCIQAASLLLIASTVASTNDTMIINVPEGKALTGFGECSAIVMQYFYKKFQIGLLYLPAPSGIYRTVSGLSCAFYHATPLVYRLSFEGEYRIPETGSVFQLEFMYDDNLLRNNDRLVSNDGHDPSYYVPTHWHPLSAHAHHEICIHSEIVHLLRGIHLIDVGFRLFDVSFPNSSFSVSRVALTIELIQYNPNVNHGLPMITPGAPIG